MTRAKRFLYPRPYGVLTAMKRKNAAGDKPQGVPEAARVPCIPVGITVSAVDT